jgi:hypothetical protein
MNPPLGILKKIEWVRYHMARFSFFIKESNHNPRIKRVKTIISPEYIRQENTNTLVKDKVPGKDNESHKLQLSKDNSNQLRELRPCQIQMIMLNAA